MLTKRIRNESPETRRNWDSAVRTLRKGNHDHYILVMLGYEPVRGMRPQWVEYVAAILAAPTLLFARALHLQVKRET
jgi:hypothetical protein